ncbi:molybdate ABC transporter substrate-binding protein [Paenactinomyces guangxiensis]|uniref:Molybdate ABC transporter substrate-binding protein n=1 Tax=Paenactinomyces guangxiensis TaxID=1490290 RepID=A0A7W1WQ12_9BACL|nr:molybdate ABC transporter substrate-binding protein [Paenactinomyces guangxiensis]MBA4493960.1 molybdate ABC transporter substrate-binding protein [Paenactinomyces guangxiensis]MBH8591427.1 molybdate ABC transporter substrate-binding protein [Paenactinomyces guangxiensis]
MRQRIIYCFMALFLIFSSPGCSLSSESPAPKVELTVSVPASMGELLSQIAKQYEQSHPQVDIRLNVGSSGALERQIEKGAPVDLFISAGKSEMEILSGKGLIQPETVRPFAGNQLVLIYPKTGSYPIHSLQELNTKEIKRISIGQPDSVPAGRYASQSLKHVGLWQKIQPKLVLAKDVRQVLTYVETNNVDAGIVYQTEAISSNQVVIAQYLDSSSHEPIQYLTGIVKSTPRLQTARQFQEYLFSQAAISILEKHGFLPQT